VRTILAVTSAGSQVPGVAAELARRHEARLQLVEARRESWHVRWIWSGWFVPPVTPQEIRSEEERFADERADVAYWLSSRSDVLFSRRRGGSAAVAAREVLRGDYDAVVIDATCRGRRLLAALLRRLDVELVAVAQRRPLSPRSELGFVRRLAALFVPDRPVDVPVELELPAIESGTADHSV